MTTSAAGDADNITFESAVLEVEREFSMMLAAARRTFKDAASAVHPGLQPLEFTVLMTLYRGGECPQGSVAQVLQVDKALLSRTVSQLETLGLVARRANLSDGRAQLLDLTPEGRVRFENAHSAKRALLRDRLGSWTPAEPGPYRPVEEAQRAELIPAAVYGAAGRRSSGVCRTLEGHRGGPCATLHQFQGLAVVHLGMLTNEPPPAPDSEFWRTWSPAGSF